MGDTVRTSPVVEAAGEGVARAIVDGVAVAARYGEAVAEYRALREHAAIVDLAFRARARVTGSDRLAFLQGMLSNDVKGLAAGDGCPALLLTEQGKVVADVVVLALADAVLLDAMATSVPPAMAALERFIVADDVEIAALDDDHAIGIFGPHAAGVLAGLGLPVPSQPYLHVEGRHDDVPLRVVAVPHPGAGGFHLHVPRRDVVRLWQRCSGTGDVLPAGQEVFEVLRIERGMPWFGRDFGPDTIALEAPLEGISFTKGCYLGQEVMERVTARGHVNRKLVGLVVDAPAPPASGDRVFAGDRDVGWITSSCSSFALGVPVALGYVRREHWEPGTRLEIRGVEGALPATVVALPMA